MPLGSIPVVLAGYGRNGSGLAAYFNKSNYFSNMLYEPKAKMMKNTLLNPELTIVLQVASGVIKNHIRRGWTCEM